MTEYGNLFLEVRSMEEKDYKKLSDERIREAVCRYQQTKEVKPLDTETLQQWIENYEKKNIFRRIAAKFRHFGEKCKGIYKK